MASGSTTRPYSLDEVIADMDGVMSRNMMAGVMMTLRSMLMGMMMNSNKERKKLL